MTCFFGHRMKWVPPLEQTGVEDELQTVLSNHWSGSSVVPTGKQREVKRLVQRGTCDRCGLVKQRIVSD